MLGFLVDFVVNFINAEKKWAYFKKEGWIDLISSIPAIEFLRLGRFAKIVRVLRVIRIIKSYRMIVNLFLDNRVQSTLVLVTLLTITTICISSVGILIAEENVGNITTASDALWWSFVSITTVGYGDYYPVTNMGRIFASMSMIIGIALLGVFTATMAAFLNRGHK